MTPDALGVSAPLAETDFARRPFAPLLAEAGDRAITLRTSPPVEGSRSEVIAARLLDDAPVSVGLAARRVTAGALGLVSLQLALTPGLDDLSFAETLALAPGMALTAAATVAMGLPAALILLTSAGAAPDWQRAVDAASRAYFQAGLLAVGFSPSVALFALTGGKSLLMVVLGVCAYAVCGFVALGGLARRLHGALASPGTQSFFIVAGYWLFTVVAAFYLWISFVSEVLR